MLSGSGVQVSTGFAFFQQVTVVGSITYASWLVVLAAVFGVMLVREVTRAQVRLGRGSSVAKTAPARPDVD